MLGSTPSPPPSAAICSAVAKSATAASGSPLQRLDEPRIAAGRAELRSVQLGEPADALGELAGELEVAAVGGDKRQRQETRRRFGVGARVLPAQALRPLGVVARQREVARPKLDELRGTRARMRPCARPTRSTPDRGSPTTPAPGRGCRTRRECVRVRSRRRLRPASRRTARARAPARRVGGRRACPR